MILVSEAGWRRLSAFSACRVGLERIADEADSALYLETMNAATAVGMRAAHRHVTRTSEALGHSPPRHTFAIIFPLVRNVTAKTAVDRLASGMPPDMVARAAIADANALEDAAFNIVVLSRKGVHASATNREGRRYVWMTQKMKKPATAARMVVSRV